MRKTIVLLSALTLLAIPAFGQWHSDTRISNTSSSSYTTYTGGWGTAADDADVYITWYDYSTSQRIRYVGFPIGSPPAAGSGDAVSTTYGYHPTIADHDGAVAVSWYYYSTYDLYTRINDGGWGSIINHGISRITCYYPAVAYNSSGDLHCAFIRSSSGRQVYYQRLNSGATSYTSPVLAYTAGSGWWVYYPSICVDPDDYVHISTVRGSVNRVRHVYSTNNGSSWNSEYATGNNTAQYTSKTSICSNSEGTLYIAYRYYTSPYQIWVVSGTTGSWGTPVNVSNGTATCDYSSIACDTADNIWVFWQDYRGQRAEIWYNRYDAISGTWDGEANLTADDDEYSYRPQVAADESGGIHVSWYDRRDGNYEIYYNWYTPGGGGGGRDLVCVKINQPIGKIPADPIKPKAVIKNNGGDVDSAYAICEITGPGSSYDEGNIEGILELQPGQEDEVEFPSWTPPGGPGDKYTVNVTVYLWPEKTTEDDDPLNNTKVEYATIKGGAEVVATTVVAPEENADIVSMIPAAYFTNVGSDPAQDFWCHCDIVGMGYQAADYADSLEITDPLAAGDSILVEFTEWVAGDDEPLPYEASFYATDVNSEWTTVPFNSALAVVESPDALRIEVSGPNPFVHGTLLAYNLPGMTTATIRVYDASGQAVRTLHDGALSGEGSLYWNGTDDVGRSLGAGLYFIRIVTPETTKTAKVVLVN